MQREYFPKGSIIKFSFDPTLGHEQAGYRPAVIISNEDFQRFTHLVRVMPISNRHAPFPLHIPLDGRTKTTGSIFTEQMKTIDPVSRKVKYVEKCPMDKVNLANEMLIESLE
ncbi:type II toxin-antitoxin system PemK/MazF family toxin [Lactiplantibacillus modestisalitolerans]|uniref:Type II toxin-antitoxin system PemK/MazF family toxin n=1 Tax=Lactiplantibacillus modestisalitolerans TaxID=1457219 RepID=A0ABV5WT81_9LACO|nr:type II toxin-antitoxin system PemK/MazF family toxin [Lactiplantibacillus modestisalitolerans]